MSERDNKLVFVSYAHKDRAFLDDEVVPFLEQLRLGEQIELWDDRMIGVGEDWYAEISDRLDHAKVAVLLVTQDFLASRFCLHEEVPVLLQRARRGELQLLPLYAKPCNWKNERWLKRIQMWPGGQRALSRHQKPKRQELLTEFAQEVLEAVERPAAAPESTARFDAPHPTHDLHRLPQTGSLLFGRRGELDLLDRAWDEGETNLVAFTAGGGVGKSTLVRVWAEMLAEDEWRGAERAFAWSFYSQGTGRMTDAETFVAEALEWFGDDTPEGLSLWDRGERLADCVRKRRTLLILDGVEPLQSGEEGVDKGSIRDPGLRTLVESLAHDNRGLCVVTTRERLSDIAGHEAPSVLHQDLDQVSTLAGRALLRVERVRGEDTALEAAVEGLGGHALAISLLARLLADGDAPPHISNAKVLPKLAHPVNIGGHPRRVLEAWADRLGDSAELELLQIVGLFDRPAARTAILAVIDGEPLPELNYHLRGKELDPALVRLREAKLIARQSMHEDTIDTHPIVREHFGERLAGRSRAGWRDGHRRLYNYHKAEAAPYPDDLVGMQSLFAAVFHGCTAGLYQEACDEVYFDRISRRQDYLTKRLGAYAADLSCLSHFFEERWSRPESTLTPADQSWVLGQAGFRLRGLGRLQDAAAPMEEGLRRRVEEAEWENGAIGAGNLSELCLILGDIVEAEIRAREAVAFADRSGNETQRAVARATQAHALHQLGQLSQARRLFVQAEKMQGKFEPVHDLLYSLRGYQYCDLLIDSGDADGVLRRAALTLQWSNSGGLSLLTIALDHLSLGHAHLCMSLPNTAAAEEHLRKAVDGLRASGTVEYIPHGLLVRARFHRLRGALELAQRDLDEIRTLGRRVGLRLIEADLALEQARWHLAQGQRKEARAELTTARQLVESMSYGRRRPEVAELEAALT